jgi:hypothetical protein
MLLPFPTRNYAVKRELCIQLYCKTKGILPLGESHFPEIIQGYQTDVIEADTRMLSNLRIGTKIGPETNQGTLGLAISLFHTLLNRKVNE